MHSSILANIIRNIIAKANNSIRFIWIPGHCGIDGTEKADKVARETVNNPMTVKRTYSALIDIDRNVSTYYTNLWESEWRRTPNNTLREIENTTIYWHKPHSFDRKVEVIINRLRIGHSKMVILCEGKDKHCAKPVENLLQSSTVYCRNRMETRKSLITSLKL